MKIAVFSDTHLGYARFEEDSYLQAERAVRSASEKADLILCAGDIFDIKIPKLETLKRAIDIFKNSKVPVFAIHGNHERRSKDMVNPAQLLAASTEIRVLHEESAIFEKGGEKLQLVGMGSMPEEYAETVLRRIMGTFKREAGAFTVLMLHQSIRELVPGGDDEISLEYLETLDFDLIINGHIHQKVTKLDGRFLIPGSTVITQLKREETEPKGYFLYDTDTRKAEFIAIESRSFFYEELRFSNAGEMELREKVREKVTELRKEHPDCIIAIKLEGTLKQGLGSSDIKIDEYENVFIENRLDMESLSARLEKIRNLRQESISVSDLALRELVKKTNGKITLFDSSELFEKLILGPEETLAYLEGINKKASK